MLKVRMRKLDFHFSYRLFNIWKIGPIIQNFIHEWLAQAKSLKLYYFFLHLSIMRDKGLLCVLICDIDTLCHSSKWLYGFDARAANLQQWNT